MTVIAVDDARGLALCESESGWKESVEIALLDPVAPGDSLLVHAGVGLVRL